MLNLNMTSSVHSKKYKKEESTFNLGEKNMPKEPTFFGSNQEHIAHKNGKNVVELDLNIEALLEKNKNTKLRKKVSNKLTIQHRNWFVDICMRVLLLDQFAWLKKQRLLRAKALLMQSDLTLEEISRKVGYKNITAFSVAYKEEFNLSPYQQKNITEIEII